VLPKLQSASISLYFFSNYILPYVQKHFIGHKNIFLHLDCNIHCLRLRPYDTGNVLVSNTIGAPYPLPQLDMISTIKETSKDKSTDSDDSLRKETPATSNVQQVDGSETTSATSSDAGTLF
jgi:hypothetical protein